jgi:acyl carrier protein
MHGFPKTINGKTDKAALIVEINNTVATDRKDTGKLTVTEKIILDIWNESLRTEGITIDDNFFEVGGNSLLAISIFSKIESAFKIKLSLRIFFDSPRIRDIGEIIDITKRKSVENTPDRNEKIYSKIVRGRI